ncbi:MAG: VWA domain-containing protein [Anaerolineales bacterium]|nr:VWA domain-containing protein [Anaerolineales bacterium]
MNGKRTLIQWVTVGSVAAMLMSGCAAAPLSGYMRPVAPSAAPAAAEAAAEATSEAAMTEAAEASDGYGGGGETYSGGSSYQSQRATVTAGVVDDNEEWNDYLDYLDRHAYEWANKVDVRERYPIQVRDALARPVHDATVKVYDGDNQVFEGRTDTAGEVFFHPNAAPYARGGWQRGDYRVVAEKGYSARSQTFTRNGGGVWSLALDDTMPATRTQLDLVFVIDATGSMGDEIQKLKDSMAGVADQIARLPEAPDVRYGLVVFRDQGDDFVVRTHDFTKDLGRFQRDLASVWASGGGDEPESVNEAIHRTLNDLSWRGDDTVRLSVLIGDAPPNLDYSWQPFSYEKDMVEAVRMGVKFFPVGASNLSEQGEYIFRQIAQLSGGKFVFLTYEDASNPSSGPGTETTADVDNYSVSTLDKLIVRLVKEELAPLSGTVSMQTQPTPEPQPAVRLVAPASATQALPVLCMRDDLWAQFAAGALQDTPLLQTAPLPAAVLDGIEKGDVMCEATGGEGWRMLESGYAESVFQLGIAPEGQPVWVWDMRANQLMEMSSN